MLSPRLPLPSRPIYGSVALSTHTCAFEQVLFMLLHQLPSLPRLYNFLIGPHCVASHQSFGIYLVSLERGDSLACFIYFEKMPLPLYKPLFGLLEERTTHLHVLGPLRYVFLVSLVLKNPSSFWPLIMLSLEIWLWVCSSLRGSVRASPSRMLFI